jgi:hypothetical protein
MVMARGGTNICQPCSETPRGQNEIDPDSRRYVGYRPGSHLKGHRLQKSLERETWKAQHGENTPMPPKS